MHTEYWGLTHSPFASHLDATDYFPSEVHEEAWARFEFLIENGRRLGFLLGGSGTGKSLLQHVAARHLRRHGTHVVQMNVVGLSVGEFVWNLASNLGHLTSPDATLVECWQAITDRLIAHRYQRLATVIMLDDVDDAQREVHSAISRLALIDPHPAARLTLLLAGQRQRTAVFGAKLNDICELRIELEPWDAAETTRYIRFALQHAGGSADVFTPEALQLIQRLSHGVPRRVRQLAELSLLAAAADDLDHVNDDVVDSVQRSLTHVGGIAEAA